MTKTDSASPMLMARVVACNFENAILDTNDLSTIRGSSLIWLRFPERLVDGLKAAHSGLDAGIITSGASELLFEFKADQGAADAVEQYLQETLLAPEGSRHEGLPLSLFTFVWAVEKAVPPGTANFRQRLNNLIAQCNYHQFRHPTIRIPEHLSDEARNTANQSTDAGSVICNLDGIRPAHPEHKQKDNPVSLSVYLRREQGRKAKQEFYKKELGDGSFGNCDFAQDFSDLVDELPSNLDLPESLKGKMALVYLDGNGFGTFRDKTYDDMAKLTEFSERIKRNRRCLLKGVLTSMVRNEEMTRPKVKDDPPRLRFETLLWGGDEVMWVLPAWHAWAFMGVVQGHLNDKTIWGDLPHATGMLTHAAGMLIAPYKAPIKDLTALVKDLGEKAKEGAGRTMNGVQIGVVTGFDLPGVEVDDLRRPLFALPCADCFAPHVAFQMDGANWADIMEAMAAVKAPEDGLPRSSLYRIYHEALRDELFAPGNHKKAQTLLDNGIERIKTVRQHISDQCLETLRYGFPGASYTAPNPLIPLHQILQLWDIAR